MFSARSIRRTIISSLRAAEYSPDRKYLVGINLPGRRVLSLALSSLMCDIGVRGYTLKSIIYEIMKREVQVYVRKFIRGMLKHTLYF